MARTLGETLAEGTDATLTAALGALAEGIAALSSRLGGAGPTPDPSETFGPWLAGSGICTLSLPGRAPVEIDRAGALALALEPLEGDPGAASGMLSGTLFSLRPAGEGFLTPGRAILAAGAALYGPQTRLALAVAGRVRVLTLNPGAAAFLLTRPEPRIPAKSLRIAANPAEARHWDRPVRRYLEDCCAGAEGPRAADHDLGWTGCLSAELHRILEGGGLLLLPRGTPRPPSLLHRVQPLACLAEAAGGRATDGERGVMDRVPEGPGATCPLVLGSADPVARVAAYHELPDSEVSPLFGTRGLFRL